MQQLDMKVIDEILERHNYDKSMIIAIMQDVQEVYRYLPQEALEHIAAKTGMSESDLFGVATFYGNFSLDAKGKYVLKGAKVLCMPADDAWACSLVSVSEGEDGVTIAEFK